MHPLSPALRYAGEIVHTLGSTNQHERVLHLVVDRLTRLTHCSTCAIIQIDPKTEYLTIENSQGLSLGFCNAFRKRIATAAAGRLLWTGAPVLLRGHPGEEECARELALEHPFRSCIAVQIAVDHRTLGYLHCDSQEADAFTDDDLALCTLFADIAAIALNKSRLFEENLRLDRVDRETGVEKYLPFLERVHAASARGSAFGEHFGVLILDIDNFKETVQTYGYDASRELLRALGETIRGILLPIDGIGRYGFDEFIVLLENCDLETSVQRARELRTAIAEQRYTTGGISTTASIGVAAFPQNGTTAEEIILTAKKAVFESQRAGRNLVCSFGDLWFAAEPHQTIV
jgi:two-component system, cell cycle response regulator